MSRRAHRRWAWTVEDDPLSGLANMFDLWVVFAIALLLALVSRAAHEGAPAADMQRLDRFTVGDGRLTGAGERLGTAYRLESGEVVYVPDAQRSAPPTSRR